MHRIVLVAVFAALAIPSLAARQGAPAQAPAYSADDIVAKWFEAQGGLDKLKAIQTVKKVGHVASPGFDVPITIYGKRPNRSRQEINVPGQGQIIDSFDGTTAWTVNPVAGVTSPTIVSGPQADAIRTQSDFDDSLMDYKANGSALELVGLETAGDKKVYHLKLTPRSGPTVDHFFDASTFLETREVANVGGPGAPMALETQFDSYRAVDGIMTAFVVRNLSGAQVPAMVLTLDTIEFNLPLDDAFFKMPAR